MFDIGFSEILVIAVVALVVIGPERLPGVARTLGHLFGRMQRYVNDVKADIQREIELDELKKFKQEVETTARSFEQSVTSEASEIEQDLKKLETLANPAAEATAATAAAPTTPGDSPTAAAKVPSTDAPPRTS